MFKILLYEFIRKTVGGGLDKERSKLFAFLLSSYLKLVPVTFLEAHKIQ